MAGAKFEPAYRRVVLKVSGEGLAPAGGVGLGADALRHVANEICAAHDLGVEVAVVVGGGNLVRGASFVRQCSIPEATAHQMGMLATVINALALQETLESMGASSRVLSAVHMHAVCEPYVRQQCLQHMEQGRVVVLAGGTGRPFVTTDSAAALAALELDADAVLKATQVEGVYTADPKVDPKAQFCARLTYDEVINQRLRVMDLSAVEMCQRKSVVIRVFNLHEPGNVKRILMGEDIGTVVGEAAE